MIRSVEQEGGVHHDGGVHEVGAVGQAAQRQQTSVRERRVHQPAVSAAAGDRNPCYCHAPGWWSHCGIRMVTRRLIIPAAKADLEI